MKRWGGLTCVPLLGGCAGVQSAFAPSGDHAARIAELTWLLFAGGAAIFALVMGALVAAIFAPPRWRARLADHRTAAAGGIAFPVVVLTVLLLYGLWLMRAGIAEPHEPALRIHVAGEQWWWRVTYPARTGPVESANEIRIPVGQPVEFELTSPDVINSFWIPSLAGKLDMIPGRTNTLRLTAERAGIYRGQCAEYCGGPHALMSLEVIALPPDEFQSWIESAARPASGVDGAGRDLFVAAGCGACHAIRGTGAGGRVGPDLSRLGERRQLAAATLPNTPENIARFITGSQSVKPGNLMPNFSILPAEDVETLSLYLAGLK